MSGGIAGQRRLPADDRRRRLPGRRRVGGPGDLSFNTFNVFLGNPGGGYDATPGTPVRLAVVPGRQNVLNITAASLNNINEITFNNQPTATSPLIVNVDTGGVGDQFTWTTPNTAGISGQQAPYILWNFPTATRLTIPGSATVEGTLSTTSRSPPSSPRAGRLPHLVHDVVVVHHPLDVVHELVHHVVHIHLDDGTHHHLDTDHVVHNIHHDAVHHVVHNDIDHGRGAHTPGGGQVGGGLPTTGSGIAVMAALGSALVGLGLLVRRAARRARFSGG